MAPNQRGNSVLIAESRGPIESIAGLPLVSPATIAILPDSPSGQGYSRSLIESIKDLLTSLQSQVTVERSPCTHGAFDVPNCPICAADDREKLLVLVSDGKTGWNAIPDVEWWLAGASRRHILPLFQTGAHPDTLLPEAVRKLNAYFWRESVAECRNAVLRAAGITPDSYRVFISYRRLETQPLAEQLFDELNRQGFSVFLDVYSVPASVQFQRRLGQELSEKGMAVLLESEQFQSPWTQEEVDICKRYQIGILAAQMPHARDGKPVAGVAGIAPRRIVLSNDDFQAAPQVIRVNGDAFLRWGRLQEVGPSSACSKLIQQIRDEHDRAWLRRRQEMRDEMWRFLTDAGADDFQWRADGLLSVASRGRRYVVWLTNRPAELPDFHVTYEGSLNSLKAKGVLVGPRDLLELDVHLQQDWLSGLCGFSSHDPGEMLDVAERMAAGSL